LTAAFEKAASNEFLTELSLVRCTSEAKALAISGSQNTEDELQVRLEAKQEQLDKGVVLQVSIESWPKTRLLQRQAMKAAAGAHTLRALQSS
jgi:hypothetical protein